MCTHPGAVPRSHVTPTRDLQEWEVAKIRQDKALDNIEKGLGVLKGLGEAMGENLGQQDVLLSEIDSKVDCTIPLLFTTAHYQSASTCQQFHEISCKCIGQELIGELLRELLMQMDLATKTLKTNNMKLKGLVTQVTLPGICLSISVLSLPE